MGVVHHCRVCEGPLKRVRSERIRHGDYYLKDQFHAVKLTAYRCKHCNVFCPLMAMRFDGVYVWCGYAPAGLWEDGRKTANSQERVGSTAGEWTKRMARGIQ